MRKTIKTTNGKVLGVWVAKTKRGFNKKQQAEIALALTSQPKTKNIKARTAKAKVLVVFTKN